MFYLLQSLNVHHKMELKSPIIIIIIVIIIIIKLEPFFKDYHLQKFVGVCCFVNVSSTVTLVRCLIMSRSDLLSQTATSRQI